MKGVKAGIKGVKAGEKGTKAGEKDAKLSLHHLHPWQQGATW